MDIEFHYYITYILAKEAGFSPEDSRTIAYSSQYTDDNTMPYKVVNKEIQTEFANYISQTMNIFKPQEEHLQIYSCFHFVPGDPNKPMACRADGKTNILNTTPNSRNSNQLLDEALETGDLYRIGIATHCYVDTWAHQNFVGYNNAFNSFTGALESLIPNIGHADVMHHPDIPNLIWEDKRLIPENSRVHNKRRFLKAAEHLFHKFGLHLDLIENLVKDKWKKLEKQLGDAIGNESTEENRQDPKRIKAYYQIVDGIEEYDHMTWFHAAIEVDKRKVLRAGKRASPSDLVRTYYARDGFDSSDWLKFQIAVKEHQSFAKKLFKPLYKKEGIKIDSEN